MSSTTSAASAGWRRRRIYRRGRGETQSTQSDRERTRAAIPGCAARVHRALGPGLLENAYERCLAHEFDKANLAYQRQVIFSVLYDGVEIEAGCRLGLLVDKSVAVEVKAVERHLDLTWLFDIAVARIRPYDPK
jgi:GxxExxY protein